VTGTILVIVWFVVAYLFAVYEEENLIAAYGNEYKKYMQRVKWRLIPHLL
jgi:protein-S-isoprenylcysteine O-methyltransferase Ste14